MAPILSILNEMRGKLGMYVGTTSITKLASFLQGYSFALYKMGADAPFDFIADFCDWIQETYHTTTVSWENLILQDSKDEADAVDHFWRLLDEFLATHAEYVSQSATTPQMAAAVASTGREVANKSA